MKWLITLLVVPAIALVPGTALGKSGAKVYKGTFTLVGADGDYVTGSFGKAQLVDNRRNDKLSVHVRRLAPKTTYTYRLQTGACKAGAPGGVDVAGFTYKPLKTNRSGNGNSTARSKTFAAQQGVKYKVVVYAGGEVALCAQLRTNWWHGKDKQKGKDDGKSGHDDKSKGKSDGASGQPKDKSKGKSDGASGQAKDKSKGKSEDASGQANDNSKGNSEDASGQADDNSKGQSEDAPGQAKPRGKGGD
jgi:hypothetical protein